MHEKDRIRSAAGLLYRSTQTIRILTHIAWPQSHREHFLKNKAYKLPKIEYPSFDASETRACLAEARALIHDTSPIDRWLSKTADQVESGA
ncbi:MAG: DUF1704 domain-containing protein, partial [Proteobacteria bacterium]|nr:DUF1704 domain-containing protein [Pseudomonadota bacterium]